VGEERRFAVGRKSRRCVVHRVHPHLQLTTIATCRDQMLRAGDGRAAARDSTLQIYVAGPRTSRSHNRPIVNALNAGGGSAYSITDSVDVFGSFSREVCRTKRPRPQPRDHGWRKLDLQPSVQRVRQYCRRRRTGIRVRKADRQATMLACPLHLSEIRIVRRSHRVNTAFQFTSHVLPQSFENACSNLNDVGVMSEKTNRTVTIRPLNGS
jgi:hypothetical protein